MVQRFRNILVAIDSRWDIHPALEWAARLAEHNQARLKIVDVLPDLPWIAKVTMPDSETAQEAFADQKRRVVDALAEPIREQGIDVTTKVLFGRTSSSIIHEVMRSGHDLVVRVSKGAHSGRTGFFGTTSMRLLRKCPCAVCLVRPETEPRFGRVLAAIDAAPNDIVRDVMNNTVMDLATSVAKYEHGEVHFVHVWELFGEHLIKSRYKPGEFAEAKCDAKEKVAAMLDRSLSPYELTHHDERVHLVCDELGPGHAISELAEREQIDLIVMGTIARTGLSGALLGNTAEKVLDRIECSVLAVKPDGFVSPVSLPDT
ncbi:MAG: universal stress protein [Pirellulales bacterium]|nr:universal stress protein [Pirellulales bacterium]